MSNAELITRLKRASWPGDLFDQAAQEIERLQSLVFSASLDGFETTNGVANDGAYRGDAEMINADLIARLRSRHEFFLNGHSWVMSGDPDSDCSQAADVIAAQDCTIADTILKGLETTNEATEQRLRAEAAEAGLRDLMEVTMKQLSPEQWKAIEPVVRDVRSLANPRAEAAEARIRAQDKTIAELTQENRAISQDNAACSVDLFNRAEAAEAGLRDLMEVTMKQLSTIASLQDVLDDVIELIPVRPEYSGQIYRASVTLAQTLAEGTQK